MKKISWVDLPVEEKQTILSNIAENKNIIDNAVEKDFWVSMVLKAIFSLSCSNCLVFKGGTSLSKGWNLIERFSEDCDLAIDRTFLGFDKVLNGSQRNKLRKASKKFIEGILVNEIKEALDNLGLSEQYNLVVPETNDTDKDPVELFIEYNSVLTDKAPYISERVKVEISCRSLMEPFTLVKMRSMIEDAYPDESFTEQNFNVPTVLPGRTFLEKIFLLHEEFNRPGGCTRIERLTRHLYDIEKMMDKSFAIEAMHDEVMYSEIVEFRSKFTAWSGLDYHSHHPSTISFVPPVHLNGALKKIIEKCRNGLSTENLFLMRI